ncbi:MAG: hypothetical protein ACOCZ7_00830 [Armatimonadota bacterium]
MAQAIVTVLILLIFVAYAVFFSLWNAGMITVVGFFWPQAFTAEVPIFVLPLAGLLIGAIVMAIAVSAPWSSLKSKLIAAEDQLDAARSRVKECEQRVEALKSRLQEVKAQTRPTTKPSPDPEGGADA